MGACDSQTQAENLTETVTPDPTAVYVWDGSQYHYNWTTKGLTAGEYRIYANLADGTKNYVDICLTDQAGRHLGLNTRGVIQSSEQGSARDGAPLIRSGAKVRRHLAERSTARRVA